MPDICKHIPNLNLFLNPFVATLENETKGLFQ